jgi:predicted nucleic acid-binding protein
VIVLDASAALEVILQTPDAPAVEDRIFAEGESLNAPHLIDLEVAQVLRRWTRRGGLTRERGTQALEDFVDLPLVRFPHEFLLSRIWELRHNLTAYDAAYVALAEILRAPLLTRDAGVAAAKGHRAKVEVV